MAGGELGAGWGVREELQVSSFPLGSLAQKQGFQPRLSVPKDKLKTSLCLVLPRPLYP